MRVMIVDDSRAMRLIVKRTLRQAGFGGHEVLEAENGKIALEMIDDQHPDVVLCDWNMPEMTGIELLTALREAGSRVKFGFVTSEGTTEMRRTAAEAGALFVITKPFTQEAFEKALKPILE